MLALAVAAWLAGSAPASPVPVESRQLLLVRAASWDATSGVARLYVRDAPTEPWRPAGASTPVALGRAGLAWGRGLHTLAHVDGPLKREGDGRSPAGVFDLRRATGYDDAPPAGARLPYERATTTLRCIDDVQSPLYNSLVDEARVRKTWTSAEDMRRADELYRLVVWVGHNDAPVEAHAGSCIFLHLRAGPQSVTAGCTAFDAPALTALLVQLDPQARPLLVQLPEAQLRARATAWGLPRSDAE